MALRSHSVQFLHCGCEKKKRRKRMSGHRAATFARTHPPIRVSEHMFAAWMCVATFWLWLMSLVNIRWLEMIPCNSPCTAILHLKTWGEKKKKNSVYLKGQHLQAVLPHSQPHKHKCTYLVLVDEARHLLNKLPECQHDLSCDMNLACRVQLKVGEGQKKTAEWTLIFLFVQLMLRTKDGFESWHNEGMTKGRMIKRFSGISSRQKGSYLFRHRKVNERWNSVQRNIYIPLKINNEFIFACW